MNRDRSLVSESVVADMMSIYSNIIERVCDDIRDVFHEEGVDGSLVHEIKNSWKSKLAQSNCFPQSSSGIGSASSSAMYNPNPNLPAHLAYVKAQPISVAALPAYNQLSAELLESQQLDGTPRTFDETKIEEDEKVPKSTAVSSSNPSAATADVEIVIDVPKRLQKRLQKLQLDGGGGPEMMSSEEEEEEEESAILRDEDEEEGLDEEQFQANTEEPALNSDDDITDDEDEFERTGDLMVGQFDKVTRTKARWKFNMSDAIIKWNGNTELCFSKVQGDAEFI